MKQTLLRFAFLFTLPLFAVTVNTKVAAPYVNAKTETIVGATIASDVALVITADLTFTCPTESPTYDTFANDKLAIVPDVDGTLLIADGKTKTLVNSGVSITNEEPVALRAEGTLHGDTLQFKVALNHHVTTVTSPLSGNQLTQLCLEGEGETDALLLALVPTAIAQSTTSLPLVERYVEWLNTTGNALANASEEEKTDAFVMNTGGTPKLEITAIDPEMHTITVRGSSTLGTTETEANLANINGTLYITYAETLNETPQTQAVDVSTANGGEIVVKFPETTRFIKARVALSEPHDKTIL